MKRLLLLQLIFISQFAFGQQSKIDSLINLLKTDKADTTKLIHLYNISDECETIGNYPDGIKYGNQAIVFADVLIQSNKEEIIQHTAKNRKAKALIVLGLIYFDQGNYTEALKCHFASLKIFEAIGDKIGILTSYINIGNVNAGQGNYPEALKNYFASLKIREAIGFKKGMDDSYNNIGGVYYYQGNYPEALKSFFAALKIRETIGDKKGMADSYNNIGSIYDEQRNFPEALKNHFASLQIRKAIGLKYGIASSYNNIGSVYYDQGNFPEALKNHFASLKIFEAIGDKSGIAKSYNNIGSVYQDQGNFPEALKSHFASLQIKEEIGDKEGIAKSYNNIGIINLKLNNTAEAKKYLEDGLNLSKKIGAKEIIRDSYKELAQVDSVTGNYKSQVANYKLYILYRDSLDNEESRKKTIQTQMTYDFEKKEAVTEAEHKNELKNQEIIAEEKNRKQKLVTYFVIGGLILVLVFAGFILNRFKVTKRQKQVIELKEKETQLQKHIIEEKHKEITDSINYAERIQRSFIASKEMLDENLTDYFVLFKPKDVVSGDFYWASILQNGNFALVTADSTGHGVPGAIMSLLNITSLEKAVETLSEPSEIFNSTRKTIIERLKKDGSEHGGKDGMDASLTVYDFKNNKLSIAVANNPVWIMRGDEVIDIKPDKMPIGKGERDSILFTQQEIDLQKGDVIYTLTDGFPDQFGGEKGKKFMSKRLRDLLSLNSKLPMNEQKTLLESTFSDWVGNLEQIDDVCLIGVRV